MLDSLITDTINNIKVTKERKHTLEKSFDFSDFSEKNKSLIKPL